MRKILAIAFSVLYVVATAGIIVSKHSCCGEVLDIHWMAEKDGCCDHGEHQCSSASQDCCSFDLMFFSVEDEHTSTSLSWDFPTDIQSVEAHFDLRQETEIANRILFPDSPDPPSLPIYLTSCSLILYA